MNDQLASVDIIEAKDAPPPGGHYSQAVKHAGLIYVSGQLPVSLDGGIDSTSSFEKQAEQAIRNMLAVLEAAGSDASRLLKVTVYLCGVENWPTFNTVYARCLGDARPARAVVPVPELHYNYLVEIDAVAAG